MNNLSLFDPPPYQAHSVTSREAAESITEAAPTMRQRVLDAIRRFGPISDELLASELDMNPSTVRPRRIELAKAGLIAQHPEKGTTASGRRASLWVIS